MPLTPVSPGKRTWAAGLYWVGVILACVCIALALVSQSEVVHRLEHTNFPVSWALAGIALISFLAAELCSAAGSLPYEAGDRDSSSAATPKPDEAAGTGKG